MYDADGRLLLKKGTVVSKQSQLDALIKRGLYRNKADAQTEMPKPSNPEAKIFDIASPFERLDMLKHEFPSILEKILTKSIKTEKSIFGLCKELQTLCDDHEDAMIAATHLMHDRAYTCFHPVHLAMLSYIVGKRLGMTSEVSMPMMAAGLTGNISMLELQEQLYSHQGPLSEEQREAIKNHPARSVRALVSAGVYNAKWLEIIMQHHERVDGAGYPEQLKDNEVSQEAQLVNIADRYTAMVSSREYREARTSNEALKNFFENKCSNCNETLTLLFIKVMGIWPPGSAVRLVNGEVGLVTRRGHKSMWPTVAAIIGPQGKTYANPLVRDCNDENYRIKSVCKLEKSYPLNLTRIWGFGIKSTA